MSPRFSLLALPSELRFAIYREYFTLPDGYVPSSNLRQLTASTGDPIELNLMYTCKLVAQETSGLALSLNVITFSTIHSDYLNLAARLLENFCMDIYIELPSQLERLCGLINPDIYTMVVDKFPFFKQRMDYLQQLSQGVNDDEHYNRLRYITPTCLSSPHSVDPHATAYTLQLIITRHGPRVVDQIKLGADMQYPGYTEMPYVILSEVIRISLGLEDWSIPTHNQVNDIIKLCPARSETLIGKYQKRWFSATAAAIFFLKSIPSRTRCQLRRILLSEDRNAVQFPAGHAKGLIPFCIENPYLRIERRISLWWNIFPNFHVRKSSIERAIGAGSNDLSSIMANWLAQALSLTSQGMPSDSMITFFDGSPAPELCFQVFQNSVRRDVAFVYAAKTLFPNSFNPKQCIRDIAYDVDRCFQDNFDSFELGLEYLRDGSTTVRCNFDPGQKWDVNSICIETPPSSYDEWIREKWDMRPHTQYNVFPQWADILGEHYLSEDELGKFINYMRVNWFPVEVKEATK